MELLGRARALARTAVLAEVPAPALVALAARVRARDVPAGATVATRKDGSDVVLVVAAGRLTDAAGDHGPGAVLGVDGALVGAAPITLTAATDAALVEIAVDDFLDVLAEHGAATTALARQLAGRIRAGAP